MFISSFKGIEHGVKCLWVTQHKKLGMCAREKKLTINMRDIKVRCSLSESHEVRMNEKVLQ